MRWCRPCDVHWKASEGKTCWNCGGPSQFASPNIPNQAWCDAGTFDRSGI